MRSTFAHPIHSNPPRKSTARGAARAGTSPDVAGFLLTGFAVLALLAMMGSLAFDMLRMNATRAGLDATLDRSTMTENAWTNPGAPALPPSRRSARGGEESVGAQAFHNLFEQVVGTPPR